MGHANFKLCEFSCSTLKLQNQFGEESVQKAAHAWVNVVRNKSFIQRDEISLLLSLLLKYSLEKRLE